MVVSTLEKTRTARGGMRAIDGWALVGTALVALLVVLVNYVSYRRYARWDLTRDRLFTLSERTDTLLAGLKQPVEIYVFMGSGEQYFQDLRELVTRYKAKSDKITAQFVDPDREPTKFRLLAEKFGVRVRLQESGQTESELAVLVSSGDKRWSITRDDLVQEDFDSLGGERQTAKVDIKTEQALSGALVQVTSGRATKVCVSEGHGEWTLEAGGERALLTMKDELKRENITVEALATRGKSELSKECDALFVLGPIKAFTADESGALERYLARGGNLLLALDPVVSGEQLLPTGLEELARAHGIRVDNNVVVELDETKLLSPSPVEHFLVTDFTEHKLVRPLAALRAPVVLALSRSLGLPEGSRAEALFKSSDKAYGESALAALSAGDDFEPGEGDVPGPLTLAALAESGADPSNGDKQSDKQGDKPQAKHRGGRLIVIGDSDWLSPQLLQQAQVANIDLLSSITGFLTEREALVAIAPRKVNLQSIMISEEGLASVFISVVLLLPLAALVLGVGVWWQRRQ
jgi:hypothetical protein